MRSIGEWFAGRSPEAGRNETLAQQWIGLEARWQACRPAGAAKAGSTVETIEGLLATAEQPGTANAKGWRNFNRAELLIGEFLTEAQLAIEFKALLAMAEARKLPSLTAHQGNAALFESGSLPERRAAYHALLEALQDGFVAGRFNRKLNRDAAGRLLLYGLTLVAMLAGALVALDCAAPAVLKSPLFTLVVVAVLGSNGAYFSRVMSFQAAVKANAISYDDYLSTYVDRMLRLRLFYGTLGAIVFYLVLRSGLLGGDAFPEMKGPDALGGDGVKPLAFGKELASLLVWSFVAGFSERLVPDSLANIEGKAGGGD